MPLFKSSNAYGEDEHYPTFQYNNNITTPSQTYNQMDNTHQNFNESRVLRTFDADSDSMLIDVVGPNHMG